MKPCSPVPQVDPFSRPEIGDCVVRLQEEIFPGLNVAKGKDNSPPRPRLNLEIGREMSRLDPFYVPSTPVPEEKEEEKEEKEDGERERVNPFTSLFSSSSSQAVKLTGSLQFSFITEEAEGREEDIRYKIGLHFISRPREELKVKRA